MDEGHRARPGRHGARGSRSSRHGQRRLRPPRTSCDGGATGRDPAPALRRRRRKMGSRPSPRLPPAGARSAASFISGAESLQACPATVRSRQMVLRKVRIGPPGWCSTPPTSGTGPAATSTETVLASPARTPYPCNMPGNRYGQFCPVAKAAEILTERWTPLCSPRAARGKPSVQRAAARGTAHVGHPALRTPAAAGALGPPPAQPPPGNTALGR